MTGRHGIDLATATAGGLAEALRRREVSARELADAAVARIEALDGAINAVVVRDFERARACADAADAALAGGGRGALLGVPMTVKESHDVAGLPTTWGLPAFAGWTAAADSVAVRRLKAAGAVILGKTNVPPLLADWQAANPIHGRTRNPWDLERTPGGSSGGSAAALAAGMVPLELGSDIAGSIRVPAAFCGVFGHKPSFGLVPMGGHAPPGVEAVGADGGRGGGVPLAVTGPMARTAADLELALGVLAGPGAGLPPPRGRRLEEHRVLVLDHHPDAGTEAEIRAALRRLGDRVEAAGATVGRGAAPLPDLGETAARYRELLESVLSDGAIGPERGQLLAAQAELCRRWEAAFSSWDVVIAPTFGTAALRHDDTPPDERRLVVDGRDTAFADQMAWSSMASLANLPATSVPVDRTASGLPIGVQVIGPPRGDRTTIAFAALLEREFGGFHAPAGG